MLHFTVFKSTLLLFYRFEITVASGFVSEVLI